jgi:Spy/CpxP family protein refolding chaperone
MKKRNIVLSTILAGSVLSVAAVGIANADPSGGCGARGHHASMHEGRMGHGGFGHMFKRLNLTEAQRDQIFQIRYAQKPAMRAKMKELRSGRQALRAAATAENYDAQKVQTLAQAQAKTLADMMVMRTETSHKIYAVLTPEQRQQLSQMRQHRGDRDGRGEGRRGF